MSANPEMPPLEDDRVAMMLGLVPDKRTPGERLWDAIRTRGESLKYHYDNSPDAICAACEHPHSGAGTAANWTYGPCFCGCMNFERTGVAE